MTTKITDVQQDDGSATPDLSALADRLVAAARTQGVELTGPGGLLTGLTKQVLETALDVELSEHLGHDRGERSGSGNVRNGSSQKTVRTDVGEVRLTVPRDRAGTFTPAVVPKHSRRLAGFDDAVLSLYAKGMTTGDIANHLADIYGTEVSRDLVSRVTDAVVEQMQQWQSRPLDHSKGDTAEIDTTGNRNLVDAAGRAGIRRFVLTSILTCDQTQQVPHFWHKKLAEDRLQERGVAYVSLRPGAFLGAVTQMGRRPVRQGTADVVRVADDPAHLRPHGASRGPPVSETRDPHTARGLDLGGAMLAVVALAASTWALTEAGPRGWTDTAVLVAGAVTVGASAAFVRRMRHTRDPLVPPSLFRDRTFTVVNLATVLLYGSLGVSFFLVAYQLQVAVGWSALEAGSALLPATVLMFVLSAASGSLAQRIGPRLQLTVGPLLAGAGLLLLARIGPDASWAADVLPGALVFGLGLVTFVAPLTATVMAAADPDHVSVASGVNNAVARAASLGALAVVPVISGLSVASGPAQVTDAYQVAMVIAACAAAAAGPLAFLGLGRAASAPRTTRRMHCAVDGPPLQPDPQRCPMVP